MKIRQLAEHLIFIGPVQKLFIKFLAFSRLFSASFLKDHCSCCKVRSIFERTLEMFKFPARLPRNRFQDSNLFSTVLPVPCLSSPPVTLPTFTRRYSQKSHTQNVIDDSPIRCDFDLLTMINDLFDPFDLTD